MKDPQKLNTDLLCDPAISPLGNKGSEITISKRCLHAYVHCGTVHNSQDMESA